MTSELGFYYFYWCLEIVFITYYFWYDIALSVSFTDTLEIDKDLISNQNTDQLLPLSIVHDGKFNVNFFQ